MKKINTLLLLTIALCLIYISFLKPLPNRYQKRIIDKNEAAYSEAGLEIFDTATGRIYTRSVMIIGESISSCNTIEDLIRQVSILRPQWKIIKLKGSEKVNYFKDKK